MTQDISPNAQRTSLWVRRLKWLAAVAVVAGVNVAIVAYRSDARGDAAPSEGHGASLLLSADSPYFSLPQENSSRASWASSAPEEATLFAPPLPFDALAGLRTPGVLQHVENITLRTRQTPAYALVTAGVTQEETHGALQSLTPWIDFRRMRPGDTMKARFDADHHLLSLNVSHGLLEQAITRRTPTGWRAERIEISVDTVMAEVSGQVRYSLWDALVGGGEDPRLVQALVDIFAYDIDFYSEVHPADRFCLLVEKRYANGQFLDYGDVTAAEFISGDTVHHAFMHRNSDGLVAYFDEAGRSLRKQLLKAPLKYAPVTSGFGVRRHPILGYTRNHNGTDYGVPVGTPVWSVGEGRVVTAGWHGGYGRLVEVMHPNGWLSQYAHLSRINVRVGQRIQQKDVVGLVGQTGLATGPHLHYGLKKNGRYVNSLAQKFERSHPLLGNDLEVFTQRVEKLMGDLNKLRVAQQPAGPVPQKG